jgi:hypothetical protein
MSEPADPMRLRKARPWNYVALGDAQVAPMLNRVFDALEQSVRLQSHYAAILNDYDGGKRDVFADGLEWMERLDAVKADLEQLGLLIQKETHRG